MAILYGGDYNPEQWPREVWADDVRLMQEAGVSMATLGVFSWARLEPEPGRYELDWLGDVMDLLHEGGIAVDLATGTASPPPWLAHRHPESLPVDADGVRHWPGGRQHYCPSSPHYRAAAVNLVKQLAARFGTHPALRMWHVNNEYGCHTAACYCDESAAHFRRWLQARYGDVDSLNHAWGTDFWSQRYASLGEVLPPRRTPTFPNPTQQIDFARFSSDTLLELYQAEAAVVRQAAPGIPVTTNFMGFFKPVDYWSWAPHVDVVSDDCYPDPADPESYVMAAAIRDLMRSLRDGQPWILMEQAPSAVNWRPVNKPKQPGQMRRLSLQSVARGADGICFFQWRQSIAGAEKFHSGMVPHGGTTTRTWREVRDLGAELASIADIEGARVDADVAIVLDWSSWWGLELDSHPSTELRLTELLLAYYRPLLVAGVTVDFVRPGAPLDRYRLVLVPNLYLVSDDEAKSLRTYAENGGTLVVSFFSGVVDENDHVRAGGYPGAFRGVLGGVVEEFAPLMDGESVRLSSELLGAATGSAWSEVVTSEGADVVASFVGGDLDGRPAVLRNATGEGTAWYVATLPDHEAMTRLLRRVCEQAGVRPVIADLPAGLEAVRRGPYLFLLNHTNESATVTVADDTFTIQAGDVLIRKEGQ